MRWVERWCEGATGSKKCVYARSMGSVIFSLQGVCKYPGTLGYNFGSFARRI